MQAPLSGGKVYKEGGNYESQKYLLVLCIIIYTIIIIVLLYSNTISIIPLLWE